jgi:hypothetical protein
LDACDNSNYWEWGTIELKDDCERISFDELHRHFPSLRRVDDGRKGIFAFCDDSGLVHTIFQRRSSGRTVAWSLRNDLVSADEIKVAHKPAAALLNNLAEQRRSLFCSPHYPKMRALNETTPAEVMSRIDPRGILPDEYYKYNADIVLPAHAPYFWRVQINLQILSTTPASFHAFRFTDGTWTNERNFVMAQLSPNLLWSMQQRLPEAEAILLMMQPHICLKAAMAHVDRLKPNHNIVLC